MATTTYTATPLITLTLDPKHARDRLLMEAHEHLETLLADLECWDESFTLSTIRDVLAERNLSNEAHPEHLGELDGTIASLDWLIAHGFDEEGLVDAIAIGGDRDLSLSLLDVSDTEGGKVKWSLSVDEGTANHQGGIQLIKHLFRMAEIGQEGEKRYRLAATVVEQEGLRWQGGGAFCVTSQGVIGLHSDDFVATFSLKERIVTSRAQPYARGVIRASLADVGRRLGWYVSDWSPAVAGDAFNLSIRPLNFAASLYLHNGLNMQALRDFVSRTTEVRFRVVEGGTETVMTDELREQMQLSTLQWLGENDPS